MKLLSLAASAVAATSLVGCVNYATVRLVSQPEGAYITEVDGSHSYGLTPIELKIGRQFFNGTKDANGCLPFSGLVATWASGVNVTYANPALCGPSNATYTFTFTRPAGAAGLNRDLQFALQSQAVRAQQQQASAAQDAADAALFRSFGPAPSRSLNCLSTKVGNLLQTSCF